MDRKETLATLKVTCSGQKYRTYNIDSKYFFPVPSQKKGEWNLWTVPTLKERKNLNRIIAVEWKSPKGLKAEKLDITATPDGIESGLVVLGSLQY